LGCHEAPWLPQDVIAQTFIVTVTVITTNTEPEDLAEYAAWRRAHVSGESANQAWKRVEQSQFEKHHHSDNGAKEAAATVSQTIAKLMTEAEISSEASERFCLRAIRLL
jgi:hypothetical protein